MRALHQVRPHEKFIASGMYQYFEDDRPAGVVEYWSIYQLPDNSEIVRVDRDGRAGKFNTSLLIEVLRNADGHIERCDIRLYYPNTKMMSEARATYNFTDEQVEIGRVFHGERFDEVVNLPAQTVIYPLAHIFIGNVIAQLMKLEGHKGFVFTPNITDLNNPNLLGGIVDERAVRFVRTESISINSKEYGTRHYQFIGGSYRQDASFWVDEYNVLIRYSYRDANDRVWTTLLTQYARKL